ncbi:acyl-CoA dehydrogenase family protein [Trinickia soli]|uniref:Pimeloyl-CoA dehydrogenase small subunit n=1 Tax=Trinickia soli TaxID=380675 RepID=A0A2N7W5I3_9BURK|nr:acyl-CoA dehydrogenase [Trinickia soli]PMS24653.1 pimeloyl-CoA dehydrogenase small subunit [Trinickia soli]CAB3651920.1 Acyl-CoA dehydrogenase fadE12 [Trinickia soli]
MNFELTEEQRMLADTLARFVAAQYGFPTRERIARSPEGFDRGMWRRFGELGAIGALFAPEHGGFGGAGDDIAVVFEQLGRALVVEPFLGALMAGSAIARVGNAQQRAWLARLIDGEAVLAFAHGEPDSRYEPARVATEAERANGGWRLNGAKAVVLCGEAADGFVVSARTSAAVDAEQGISLFWVPRDVPGMTLRGYALIDGGRGAELALRDVALPADALLGEADDGFATLEAALGCGLLALSAQALGAMEQAFGATLDYLRTRRQFGVPIGSFQALQHRMADLAIDIEQARSAVINAAAALAGPRRARERALSAAKYTVGQVGSKLAREAVQLHGGIGMTWELPLAHYAKRLVMIDHQLGDEDHHLARYIGFGFEGDAVQRR